MRLQKDFDPVVARLGDRNEMLFCMICAWAEKLGKTHTWLWKWYSASEATIRRPEMHMLIKLTIFLPDPRRACRTAQRRTKCRSYYVCKIVDFFPKLTTHNTVLCIMCHSAIKCYYLCFGQILDNYLNINLDLRMTHKNTHTYEHFVLIREIRKIPDIHGRLFLFS